MESLLFFPLFLSLIILSSSAAYSYTPPSKYYYINCGSESSLSVGDRNFTGDKGTSDNSISVGRSEPVKTDNSSWPAETLYQTARIFKKPSSYAFDIDESGTYLVRFHFFPFSSRRINLVDGSFDVEATKLLLLSNFNVRNRSSLPVIEEFLLSIPSGRFQIDFFPHASNFAFVNAMEVFLLPDNFTGDEAFAVPPAPGDAEVIFHGVESNAFRTLYLINIGGSEVTDTLGRKWAGDDDKYLVSKGTAQNCTPYPYNLDNARNGVADAAPPIVYQTCKVVNGSNFSNITWSFQVRRNSRHYVRLHFCDIFNTVSASIFLRFNLFVYSQFNKTIDPHELEKGNTVSPLVPFFSPFVVDSDASGYLRISISPREESSEKIAFLNGLEIFEFVSNTSLKLPPYKIRRHHSTLFVVIVSVCAAALLSILVVLVFFALRLRKSKPGKAFSSKTQPSNGKGKSPSWVPEKPGASPVTNLNLKLKMPFAKIMAATQNFNTKLLIGEGGFGKVYTGTLENGTKVAVKRSTDLSHGQGLYEFQTEVLVLSKIRHRHLVSLIGYCDEGNEMILVYEFMEKGTLRDHLYSRKGSSNRTKPPELSWKQRLEICIGAAKGLHYLHTGSDEGIIHRDVKSTNILLDDKYVAKVADFGLSQSGPPDPDHVSAGVKGSFGYLDPEYFKTLQLTDKSDVYSFGVVLLEALCARPPIVSSDKREEINLVEWGMFWQKKGQLDKIIDPLLAGDINPNSLRKFGEIAEKCLRPEGVDRPDMIDVCWDLEYALQLQKAAIQREPYEDSLTEASANFIKPIAENLNPSIFPSQEAGVPTGRDDDSDVSSTGMFSQHNIDGAR